MEECEFCDKSGDTVYIDINDESGNDFKICETCDDGAEWVRDY